MSENQFDEIFRDKLGGYPSPVPDLMWEKIQSRKRPGRPPFYFWKWFSVLLLTLTLGFFGGYYFAGHSHLHTSYTLPSATLPPVSSNALVSSSGIASSPCAVKDDTTQQSASYPSSPGNSNPGTPITSAFNSGSPNSGSFNQNNLNSDNLHSNNLHSNNLNSGNIHSNIPSPYISNQVTLPSSAAPDPITGREIQKPYSIGPTPIPSLSKNKQRSDHAQSVNMPDATLTFGQTTSRNTNQTPARSTSHSRRTGFTPRDSSPTAPGIPSSTNSGDLSPTTGSDPSPMTPGDPSSPSPRNTRTSPTYQLPATHQRLMTSKTSGKTVLSIPVSDFIEPPGFEHKKTSGPDTIKDKALSPVSDSGITFFTNRKKTGRKPRTASSHHSLPDERVPWSLDLYASPDLPINSLHTGHNASLPADKSQQQMNFSWTIGVKLHRSIGQQFIGTTGFQFSRINGLNTSDSGNHKTHVRLNTIDIPFLLGYEWRGDNYKLSLNSGFILNIYSHDQVAHPDVSSFKNNSGLSWYLGLDYSRRVSDRLSLFAEPYLRYRLSNMAANGLPYTQKIHALGLSLGIRYNFGAHKQHK